MSWTSALLVDQEPSLKIGTSGSRSGSAHHLAILGRARPVLVGLPRSRPRAGCKRELGGTSDRAHGGAGFPGNAEVHAAVAVNLHDHVNLIVNAVSFLHNLRAELRDSS